MSCLYSICSVATHTQSLPIPQLCLSLGNILNCTQYMLDCKIFFCWSFTNIPSFLGYELTEKRQTGVCYSHIWRQCWWAESLAYDHTKVHGVQFRQGEENHGNRLPWICETNVQTLKYLFKFYFWVADISAGKLRLTWNRGWAFLFAPCSQMCYDFSQLLGYLTEMKTWYGLSWKAIIRLW